MPILRIAVGFGNSRGVKEQVWFCFGNRAAPGTHLAARFLSYQFMSILRFRSVSAIRRVLKSMTDPASGTVRRPVPTYHTKGVMPGMAVA